MVDGTLYTSTSPSQVAAINAATGETKWVFDPKIYENGLGGTAGAGLKRGRRDCIENERFPTRHCA